MNKMGQYFYYLLAEYENGFPFAMLDINDRTEQDFDIDVCEILFGEDARIQFSNFMTYMSQRKSASMKTYSSASLNILCE
jgi:hypothetical protein